MKIIATVLLASALFMSGCHHPDDVPLSKGGYFQLSQLAGSIPGGRTKATGRMASSFNLGDVKSSSKFYFLLGNGGSNPITDIELTSSNQKFVVSPSEISELGGKNSTDNSLIPMISLNVIHGVHASGIGFTDVLPMGENTITVTITGNTIENGETIELKSEFEMTVNAKVMDVSLIANGVEEDMLNPTGGWNGLDNVGGLATVRQYEYFPGNFKVKNIGNVDITMTVRQLSTPSGAVTVIVIPVNQTADVTIPEPPGEEAYMGILAFDGDGTITDQNRITLATDGKGYLVVYHVKQ